MKKVLLIRRTKEYYDSGTLGWKEHKFFAEFADHWNFSFGMNYISFRKELVKISEESIFKSKFDLIIPYEDPVAVNALPLGSLLFPMDEDDWLSSSLIPEIDKIFTGKHLYWDIYRIWTDGNQKRVSMIEEDNLVETCGYAISLPIEFRVITHHWVLAKSDAQYLPKMLSLKLDTAASMSCMAHRGQHRFEAIVKHMYQAINLPKLFPEEYFSYWDKYVALCEELLSSSKIPYKHLFHE
jgi:hypothetical protein